MAALGYITLMAGIVSLVSSYVVSLYLNERVSILGSFVGLERSLNEGIAFGLRIPGALQFILILTALLFVGWYAFKRAQSKMSQVAFGLILGGGIANLVDRLMDGLVTDFIQVGTFPVFNVADSCITVGILILFVETVVCRKG